jgi:hypothetical protein
LPRNTGQVRLRAATRPAIDRPATTPSGAARALQALDLRIAGATYRQIAAQLAANERTVFYDVQDAFGTLGRR